MLSNALFIALLPKDFAGKLMMNFVLFSNTAQYNYTDCVNRVYVCSQAFSIYSFFDKKCVSRSEQKTMKWFKGRNFRVFRVFGIFSRKFLPGKKLNKKFAKVNFAKNEIFLKIIATKIEHSQKTAKVSSVNFLQKVKIAKLKSAKFRDFSVSRKFLPLK